MPPRFAWISDRSRGGTGYAGNSAGRDEAARDGDSASRGTSHASGIAENSGNPRGVQSFGKRSGTLSRFGRSPASTHHQRKRISADQFGGRHHQSDLRGKPFTYRVI